MILTRPTARTCNNISSIINKHYFEIIYSSYIQVTLQMNRNTIWLPSEILGLNPERGRKDFDARTYPEPESVGCHSGTLGQFLFQ